MVFGMSNAPLSAKYLHALQATALGKVFRTFNSQAFKLTGPCSSRILWTLSRMGLIADPPGGPLQGCHRMVLTAKGMAALRAALPPAAIYALCQEAPPLGLRRAAPGFPPID
jgi:hypothetical protein